MIGIRKIHMISKKYHFVAKSTISDTILLPTPPPATATADGFSDGTTSDVPDYQSADPLPILQPANGTAGWSRSEPNRADGTNWNGGTAGL